MLAAMNQLDGTSSSSSEDGTSEEYNFLRMIERHQLTCATCRGRRANRREGRRLTFNEVTEWLDDDSFKRVYRMTRHSFRHLVNIVHDDLIKDDSASTAHDGAIPVQVRVGMAIRVLAGGSPLDLMQLFHIPRRTIDEIVHDVISVFGLRLKMPGVPTTYEECRYLSNAMRQSRRETSPFHGCLGAVDGIAVRINKPPENDLPRDFRSHKGFFALPLLCLVDGNYRILAFSLRCVGATNDSLSFAVSNLAALLRSGNIPFEFWIAGDEGFICTENVITPYPGSEAPPGSARDTFNYYLSSLRVHVEQAFGILVSRWEILKSYMQYTIRHTVAIIRAAILLHNYCLERSERMERKFKGNASNSDEEVHWKAWVRTSGKVFDELECRFGGVISAEEVRKDVSIRRREMVELVRHLRRPRPHPRVQQLSLDSVDHPQLHHRQTQSLSYPLMPTFPSYIHDCPCNVHGFVPIPS